MTTRALTINTLQEPIPIQLASGQVLFIAGPNGAGKSALLYDFGRQLGRGGEIFPGHRQISFNNDDVDQLGQSIETFRHQMSTQFVAFSRVSNPWSEQHIKSVVRRFINYHNQDQHDLVMQSREYRCAVDDVDLRRPLMLPALNSIFESGKMSVRFCLEEGLLKATRGGDPYGIDHLSDGERAALLLVAGSLVQSADGVIAIDEPERHLHPGIAGPLISALVRVKNDIGYIFASHDLDLIDALEPSELIHVRDSVVVTTMSRAQNQYEIRRYDVTRLGEAGVDEELRNSVLGARKKLLLVEGTVTSDDLALYSAVYEDWRVVARGGCDEVVRGVKALAQNKNLAWLEARGVIDGDGRSDTERKALESEGIYSLRCPTVENVFLDPEILTLMARALADLKGGADADARMTAVRGMVQGLAEEHFDEISARRVQWMVNRRVSEAKVSVADVLAGVEEIPAIDVGSIRRAESQEIRRLISNESPDDLIRLLPIKNTKITGRISQAVGYDNFADYKRSVLRQMESGAALGERLKVAFQSILPILV